MTPNMVTTMEWLRSNHFVCNGCPACRKDPMMKFTAFSSWDDVLAAAAANDLYYHAPLDLRPVAIGVVKVYKNRKIRIRASGITFTADEGHLNRFRKGAL